jgi:moderate conductance mechanosensitive channel
MTNNEWPPAADWWHVFWHGSVGEWILTKGLRVALILIASVLIARFINWTTHKVTGRLDERFQESDALVRSEATKHRQAMASVISWGLIALLYVMVVADIVGVLGVSVGSLVAPAAVLGAALGFGAQRVVQDLLSGFFIIAEKQYGFGDLVQLAVSGSATEARGTVEDVTLRVTKLRSSDGEVFTIPNGLIVKTTNLSKDWARAVVEIPIPVGEDLNRVNDVLHAVAGTAVRDPQLSELLLDEPALMGVESIEPDTVRLRMVARTLPGKQFDVGRRLRALIVAALGSAGIVSTEGSSPTVGAVVHPSTVGGAEQETQGPDKAR